MTVHGTLAVENTHKPELAQFCPFGLYQALVLVTQSLQVKQFCGEVLVQDMTKPQLQTQVTTIDLKQALP